MLLRIKLAAFASIIIASGATETTQTVAESPSRTSSELENISAVADSTHRELYGSSDDDVGPIFRCPEDQWCDTVEECLESEAALDFTFNTVVNNPCVGGCVLRDGGRVSWVTGDPKWWDKNCAPDEFSRVCCPFKETDKPTASPTWLDDSWGGDKWDGGSSSNNKWN
eukprot:scaffold11764_cov105-Skeletonema_dohrnii-CCMP3373.AAC.1